MSYSVLIKPNIILRSPSSQWRIFYRKIGRKILLFQNLEESSPLLPPRLTCTGSLSVSRTCSRSPPDDNDSDIDNNDDDVLLAHLTLGVSHSFALLPVASLTLLLLHGGAGLGAGLEIWTNQRPSESELTNQSSPGPRVCSPPPPAAPAGGPASIIE